MTTKPLNVIEIIKAEIDRRIKAEVDVAVEKIIDKINKSKPEILARLAVDIALQQEIMELGNIIRFDIRSRN